LLWIAGFKARIHILPTKSTLACIPAAHAAFVTHDVYHLFAFAVNNPASKVIVTQIRGDLVIRGAGVPAPKWIIGVGGRFGLHKTTLNGSYIRVAYLVWLAQIIICARPIVI
jgi:hypothetical protein